MMKSLQRPWVSLSKLSIALSSVALLGYPFASLWPIFQYAPHLIIGSSLLFTLPLILTVHIFQNEDQNFDQSAAQMLAMFGFGVFQQLIFALHLYGMPPGFQAVVLSVFSVMPLGICLVESPGWTTTILAASLAAAYFIPLRLSLFSPIASMIFSAFCATSFLVGLVGMLAARYSHDREQYLFIALGSPIPFLLAIDPVVPNFVFNAGLVYVGMLASIAASVFVLYLQSTVVKPPLPAADAEGLPEGAPPIPLNASSS